jgi:RNA polymerase sigma factor (TIGR02999 family)
MAKHQIRGVLRENDLAGPKWMWSKKQLAWLESLDLHPSAKLRLEMNIEELKGLKVKMARVETEHWRSTPTRHLGIRLLMTIPGVGTRTRRRHLARRRWRSADAVYWHAIPASATAMNQVTRILSAIHGGDGQASEQLLPLVYAELRKLAAERLSDEKPGQTLQATALVHEAYLRLVDVAHEQEWDGRGHFFAAAAEAMRRILIERARHRLSAKAGGGRRQLDIAHVDVADRRSDDELVALDDALNDLEAHDPQAAQLVKLRYFAGLTHQQAAEALGISRRTADGLWALARAWLYQQIARH